MIKGKNMSKNKFDLKQEIAGMKKLFDNLMILKAQYEKNEDSA